jgi:hypothetical protein
MFYEPASVHRISNEPEVNQLFFLFAYPTSIKFQMATQRFVNHRKLDLEGAGIKKNGQFISEAN